MDHQTRRSPAPGERKRDPERTKARIVEAAIAEFGAKGYAATRISDIADRAGVNKQLISYYFGGKEGLYNEIARAWHQRGGEMMDPDQPLADVVASFVMTTAEQRAQGKLMVWANLADGTPESGDAEFMRGQVARLAERQAAGELPPDIDPAFLMLVLMAAASAPLVLPQVARQITGEDPESPEFARRYADQLARVVRHLSGGGAHG
ncbi:TetR/AcrR family transcriptional regulator [Lentzea tibetensis]|uniref:TetR/AcrR family transcriptional regulator n=1 Tax=Lentzea tibetensis TaxID=2591470 RepID=UPI001F283CE0|nr:TetR family transcriptional regulator [Lentzea tibetensis]